MAGRGASSLPAARARCARFPGYDRCRWPAWREWAAGAAQIPSRAIALERLELLGVLDGEEDGRLTGS
jgi:hypothetical protein